MKKLAIMFLFCSLSAFAQNGRWDLQGTTTQAQGGNLLPVYAIPGASVSFFACSSNVPSSCTSAATTFTGAGTACPSTAQVNPQGSLACTGKSDTAGNFGAWFAPGTYAYTLTAGSKRYGPYMLSVGGLGGSVINFTAGTLPPLFTTSVASPSVSPALSFTASTAAQNSILAGPSSGGAGAYSFRALAVADIPPLNQNTTGTAGGLSGSPAITVSNLTDSALTPGQCAQASTGGLLVSIPCGGSVVNFGAGNLSSLFTTAVSNPTTNPGLSFIASTAAQNSFLAGPATGGTGAYAFRAIVAADLPALNQMPLYSPTGTLQASPHIVIGSATLVAGTLAVTLTGAAVFTGAATYTCSANDVTALQPVQVAYTSGSAFTLTGTTTDVIRYNCAGN